MYCSSKTVRPFLMAQMIAGLTSAKEEKVLVNVPGPYENDYHNILLYIGYSTLVIFVIFAVAIICSFEIRLWMRVFWNRLKKKLVRATSKIYPRRAASVAPWSTADPKGKEGCFKAVEVVDGMPVEAGRTRSPGGSTGSMATVHLDNEL